MNEERRNLNSVCMAIGRYIMAYTAANSICPTIREICVGTSIHSTSTVSKYIRRMADSGMIECRSGMCRGIVLTPEFEAQLTG